jgi:hypothetical protein
MLNLGAVDIQHVPILPQKKKNSMDFTNSANGLAHGVRTFVSGFY